MSIAEILLSIAIGVFTGFASGLMGIGGGALGTPLIRLLLQAPPIISLATTMPVMFPSAVSGATAYIKQRKVDTRLAIMLLITAAPMTWIGAIVTTMVSGQLLMIFTAVFLTIIGLSFLVRSSVLRVETDEEEPLAPVSTIAALVVGTIGGFLAGLLAIGGGVVYVPAILRIFKRPMKVALATSLIVVMAVSIPGTIKHAMLGHINWQMAALISIGAFPSAFFGAKLALKLRNRTLERIFGICTITFGVYFFFSQL